MCTARLCTRRTMGKSHQGESGSSMVRTRVELKNSDIWLIHGFDSMVPAFAFGMEDLQKRADAHVKVAEACKTRLDVSI
jgi:hypothetical protein